MLKAGAWVMGRQFPGMGVKLFEHPSSDSEPLTLLFDPYPDLASTVVGWDRRISLCGEPLLSASAIVLRDTPRTRDARPIVTEEVESFLADMARIAIQRPAVYKLSFQGIGRRPKLHRFDVETREFSEQSGSEEVLRTIRALEISAHLHWSGAVQRPDGPVFQLPSGVLADGFVRLGDMLYQYDVVCSIADWLDPHLADSGLALVSDTWTILPLIQEAKLRATRNGRDLPIRCLQAYPSTAELASVLARMEELVDTEGVQKILFVVSVVSSEQLIRSLEFVEDRLADWKCEFAILPLVRTSSSPTVNLEPPSEGIWCDVGGINRRVAHLGEAPEEPTTDVILIDAHRYYPVAPRRTELLWLHHEDAARHRDLWEAADEAGAIRINVYDSFRKRNLAISFDVASLLRESSSFFRRVLAALREGVPLCDVAVVPSHSATNELHRLLKRAYGSVEIVTVHEEEDGRVVIDGEDLRRFQGQREILFLDDAFVHGRTLRAVHRYLQEQFTDADEHAPAKDYQIWAFAPLARPETPGRWARLVDSLRQRPSGLNIAYAHLVHVPEANPFARERELLAQLLAALSKAGAEQHTDLWQFCESRLDQLRDPDGLAGDLYPVRDDELQREPRHVSPHSLFGEKISEAVAFAAVSTAMHECRHCVRQGVRRGSDPLYGRWDVPRILTAYHDPLLASAFLRSASPGEMQVERTQRPFSKALVEVSFQLDSIGSPLFAGELGLAVVTDKIPAALREAVWRRCTAPIKRVRPEWLEVLKSLREAEHLGEPQKP